MVVANGSARADSLIYDDVPLSAPECLSRMWQLPSTWRLLKHLSRPFSFAIPSLADLQQAVLDPSSNDALLPNLHGRLLGLSAGASAQSKWLAVFRRFVKRNPHDFYICFTSASLSFSQVSGAAGAASADTSDLPDFAAPRTEADNRLFDAVRLRVEPQDILMEDEDGVSEDDADGDAKMSLARSAFETGEGFECFSDFSSYSQLSPPFRLLLLHGLAEAVMSDSDALSPTLAAKIAEIPPEELRLKPFGTDAVGNVYWYFDDKQHLFREPSVQAYAERKKRAKEEKLWAIKQMRKEERLQKEREKEQRRKEREEKRRSQNEKWARRVSASGRTRASRAVLDAVLAGKDPNEAPDSSRGNAEKQTDETDKPTANGHAFPIEASIIEDAEMSDGLKGKRKTSETESESGAHSRRSSGRQRKFTPAMLAALENAAAAKQQKSAKRRRQIKHEFADKTLRDCPHWEQVCSSFAELREFRDRFGDRDNIPHTCERALVDRIDLQLIPVFEELSVRVKKEQQKRERAEVLALIPQKRSSRVQALELKREAEAKAQAAAAEEERVKEKHALLRRGHLKSLTISLGKQLSREVIQFQYMASQGADRRAKELQMRRERKRSVPTLAMEGASLKRSRRLSVRHPEHIDNPDSPSFMGSAISSELSLPEGKDGVPNEELVLSNKIPSTQDNENIGRAESSEIKESSSGLLNDGMNGKGDQSPSPMSENDKMDMDSSPSGDVVHAEEKMSVKESGNGSQLGSEGYTGQTSDHYAKVTLSCNEEDVPDELAWRSKLKSKLPCRVLTSFTFINKDNGKEVPLESLGSQEMTIFGFGVAEAPEHANVDPVCVEIHRPTRWFIEYGQDPHLWVETEHANYLLHNPAPEYKSTFQSGLGKFEICARIAILGRTMRPAELTYASIVDLLEYRYEQMKAYRENDIITEMDFILEQIKLVDIPALSKSGFAKQLRSKQLAAQRQRSAAMGSSLGKEKSIKSNNEFPKPSEDEPLSKAIENTKISKRLPSEGKTMLASASASSSLGPSKTTPKKRRSSNNAQGSVPRPVAAIISSLLKNAMKGHSTPSRKRKPSSKSNMQGENPREKPTHMHNTKSIGGIPSEFSSSPKIASAGRSRRLILASNQPQAPLANADHNGAIEKGKLASGHDEMRDIILPHSQTNAT